MTKKINRLFVIGLGLIGASLAKAAKDRNLCNQVVGYSHGDAILTEAITAGVVDVTVESIEGFAEELGSEDIVVIAVPTLAVPSVVSQLKPLLDDSVTVSDVASVKGCLLYTSPSPRDS